VGKRAGALCALIAGAVVAALAVLPVHAHRGHAPRAAIPAPVVRRSRHARRRTARLLRHHDRPVPILEYHVIAPAGARAAYPLLYVSPARFRAQIDGLARAGYHGVTLAAVFAYWKRGVPLPRKPVVVSFDDGYLSDYTRALPLLRRLRWPGVLNLELANVRVHGGLTAAMVRALIAAGWEIDSHTLTHPDLTTVSDDRLRRELVGSRRELRRRFGVRADYFCYPIGRYDARVERAVRRAGYAGAVIEGRTPAVPAKPFELGRLEVPPSATARSLAAELAAVH
jgi:peptidoglycan/xylan/chitin deacetylase (PgdA/CDA1 family)